MVSSSKPGTLLRDSHLLRLDIPVREVSPWTRSHPDLMSCCTAGNFSDVTIPRLSSKDNTISYFGNAALVSTSFSHGEYYPTDPDEKEDPREAAYGNAGNGTGREC